MTKKKQLILGICLTVVVVAVIAVAVQQRSLSYATSPSSRMGGLSAENSYGAADMMMAKEESMEMELAAPSIAPVPARDGSVVAPDAIDRLIIRNGSVSLVVDDVRGTVAEIHQLTESVGGFVVSSNIDEFEDRVPHAYVSVRIPATTFDSSMGSVRALGQVEQETVTGRDVTEEYVDMEAQLGNLHATETQFLEIMTRATEITDVLAVQRELSNVRRQIEQIEGRIKYLQESADFSLLTISLSTDPEELPLLEKNEWRPLVELKAAIRSLIEFGQSFVSVLVWFAIYSPVWIVLLLVGRYVYKKWIQSAA